MRGILALTLLLLLWAPPLADPPVLTDLQKLTLQNRVLAYQLAQAQLEAVIKDLAVPGYDLDLVTLSYVKKKDGGP